MPQEASKAEAWPSPVYGVGLENQLGRNPLAGSNPAASAKMNSKLLNRPLFKNPILDRVLNAVFLCIVIWATTMIAVSGYIYMYGYLPAYKAQQNLLDVIKFIQENENKTPNVVINNRAIPVELALSAEEKQRGLSGRQTLAADRGMLFIFSLPDFYSFGMPDMNFPIDIIWIDSERRIIGAAENAEPLKNNEKPVWYQPARPAQYVLEVNAGFVKRYGIEPGTEVAFKNIAY